MIAPPADRKLAFAPVVAAGTRLLVLGSLPGEQSLAAGRYYAHPQNRFWHLAGAVIGHPDLPALAYRDRLGALLEAGVGLWDTIASATRRGSLDGAIRDPALAPLGDLVARLPALEAIAFNGATAAKIGRTALAGTQLPLIDLPSSSAAYAAMPFAAKLGRWLELRRFVG